MNNHLLNPSPEQWLLVQTSQAIIEKSRHTVLPTIIIELSLLITESLLFINKEAELQVAG